MAEYNHKRIEKKWQEQWENDALYKAPENPQKKCFVLDMYPYPSGDGLHVGHVEGYTATDIYSRFKRMNGFDVLHPMGWDAFGLPAENHAIKTGVHPEEKTNTSIDTFRRQIKDLGLSYDWSREIGTHTPDYYKWTQWFFLFLYQNGLAYKDTAAVNWCESCKTVLANEQVVNGACERCKNEVVQKDLAQWFFKITDYADALLEGLEEIDWPESTKQGQRNWIGKSEGAKIEFPISNSQLQTNANTQAKNTKSNVVLVRGCADSEEDKNTHWLPWVEEKLTEVGVEASRPDMPTPWDTRYEEWKKEFEKLDVNENSTLVGHSCGCAFLVRWLGETKQHVKKLILVAPWKTSADSEGEKELYDFEIDSSVKERVSEIVMFTSDNEEKAGKESLEIYKDALGGRVIELENRGHYAKKDMGTVEFPELLDEILATDYQISTTIPVFTTRPDTLFGATYLVLSPEHKEITKIQDAITNWSEVETYIKKAKKKTELERTAESKEKTGVKLEGVAAINPANGEEIPVFIADYVLAHYGTGAIMAVPAHDERDFAFAQVHNIPIRHVIMPSVVDTVNAPRENKSTKERHNVHAIVYNPEKDAYLALHSKEHDWKTVVIGGVEEGEDVIEAAKREVREETGYTDLTFHCILGGPVQAEYFAKHKDENRRSVTQAIYFTLESEKQEEAQDNDGEVIWVSPKDFVQGHMINSELPYWLERLPKKGGCVYTGPGVLINSKDFDGMDSGEAKQAITKHVGGEMKTTYKLRDWLISRQRYWGAPIPVVYDPEGNPHPVPEEHLPWELPRDVEFKPTGTSPLAESKELKERTETIFGKGWTPEVDTMDTFVCSSWYYFRFADPHNDAHFAEKENIEKWLPVDLYVGGAEHTVLHLLYARFFTKVLHDHGYVSFTEPFQKLRHPGMVLGPDGQKMSKSIGNVINPDEEVAKYGADTIRMYEMFLGPLNQEVAWNPENIIGVRRFIERLWRLSPGEENELLEVQLHKTIKKVTKDIEAFNFNTAISQIMVCLKEAEQEGIGVEQYKTFLRVVAPFAPHLTEELWHQLGHSDSVHTQQWPEYDPEKIRESEMTIAVQINGKVRDSFTMPTEAAEEEVKQEAQKREAVQKWLTDAKIERVIYVPGKLVNIVKARE